MADPAVAATGTAEPASDDAAMEAGGAAVAKTAGGATVEASAISSSEPLRGIGVSPGFAAGPVCRAGAAPRMPAPRTVSDVEAELAGAAAALRAVAAELARRADATHDATAAEILRAQVMMAEDPVLDEAVADAIRAGSDAPHAIDAAFAVHRQAFLEAGGYLAERVADLDDLRDRAVAVSSGAPMPGIPSPDDPFVLVATDLAPADTAGLDPERVLALVTEAGGPTSHTAILARSLGIPAVVRCGGAAGLRDGMVVAVDGAAGTVRVGVDEATVADSRRREQDRRARAAASTGPGRTADGWAVELLANVGTAADPVAGAEGVGLFRTELLYLDRQQAPSHDEQVEAYAAVFDALGGRKIVVRTLDAGADKPLPFLDQSGEPNPALGVRGVRLARRDPALLDGQLAAIAAAAARTGATAWVMAPMIATPAEARDFVSRARAAGLPSAGVMVEIPAAALRVRALLREVDFLSVGTNDLSQYAFAADRMCGDLAELLDPWQPGLLDLIAMCARAGRAAGKPVGICGEAAADPGLAPVFAGLGITSLSMPARAIPAVRDALAVHTRDECERIAGAVLAADDPEGARAAATA
ncbi:phosphoenolpyruvate--protein phosphotransferase [Asanoa sp. WMMD1127]|uniref:phosphoenolpyruvate--protein phosphotransferase n=1 Tax=Asanoa sp. WMMD1127 TaxID=3016107 RepID=UPI002415A90E|nr:phosphoenolpyruvate--protein phosphotransferase [Asanoa sp. WMMD1127]MDG4826886.1 phosphoenolpyruvate--protein phosphotransferase [Asanoa sp. WMMD1127]